MPCWAETTFARTEPVSDVGLAAVSGVEGLDRLLGVPLMILRSHFAASDMRKAIELTSGCLLDNSTVRWPGALKWTVAIDESVTVRGAIYQTPVGDCEHIVVDFTSAVDASP